jgi:hypothetical protein
MRRQPDLVTQAFALLAEYVADEPCQLDADGTCQTHGEKWLPCRKQRTRELLDAWQAGHAQPVTEYGHLMSGGGWHLRWDDPCLEEIYPLAT